MIKEHKGILIKDREISWLSFNERVLQEAEDPNVPLLERIKFLAIFSSNLDEFFRVRVASLRRLLKLKRKSFGNFRYHPEEILKEIQYRVVELQDKFNDIYETKILKELENHGIYIVNENQLNPDQDKQVKQYFKQEVLPHLFPVIINKHIDFPHLRDKSIYLAVKMSRHDDPYVSKSALIEIPTHVLNRFYILPQQPDGKTYIMLLDDVIRNSLSRIFSIFDYDSFEAYTIKLTRDAELELDNDITDKMIDRLEKSLKLRSKGMPVRFVYDENIPRDLLYTFTANMKLSKQSFIPGGRYHNFKDFMDFPKLPKPDLYYDSLPPIPVPALDKAKVMFDAISERDFILHHPYQSFDYVIRLLRESAIDPFVFEIRITLYRVAKHSNVVNALINAVKNGKKVIVFMELQARFDEESNIYWTNKLQEAGAKVFFGKPGQKIHSKICIIFRKEDNRIAHYAHLSTGNYNAVTSRLYCDHGLLTKDKRLTSEIVRIFNHMEDENRFFTFRYLLLAPEFMRNAFTTFVHHEMSNAKKGRQAYIILKMNSLVDEDMIKKLYEASQAGVQIQIIVRGTCCLVPGVKGVSENIQVISIIDRFLEHARVYIFCNNGNEKMYLASADWMSRNLNRRVETAFPVFDQQSRKEIRDIIELQLNDNVKARIINKKQNNHYKKDPEGISHRAQYEIYNYIKSRSE